ncbi:MAG: glycoside hydrolase family 15 protein [Acidobacteriota bacterium]
MSDFKRIEDYGIIGNLETSALVGNDGSIDWLCLPDVDSASVLAAILDPEKGGRFFISPVSPRSSRQSYIDRTNVLVTTFRTSEGEVELTDFMPVLRKGESGHRAVMRRLRAISGPVEMQAAFEPRFDYGATLPRLEKEEGGIVAVHRDRKIILQSPVSLEMKESGVQGRFTLREGETKWFILWYGGAGKENPEKLLDETIAYWKDWLHQSRIYRPLLQAPWSDYVLRSALALKLLTNEKTGAVVAAPTTSLPETLGGVRNWDYRYSWIRDSAFTIQAFEHLGFFSEARAYFNWLKTVCHMESRQKAIKDMRLAYTIHGNRMPEERDLEHLRGYRDSAPVRVGNAASHQLQLDIYGEVVGAFYLARHSMNGTLPEYWPLIQTVADHVCGSWMKKDNGIWELRSEQRHLTHSKLMCWFALDRALRMAREFHLDAPMDKWTETREAIRSAILDRAFSRKLNSFVQAFDYEVLDSACLLIPVLGFLPPRDPRVLSTIETIRKGLSSGEFLHRYEGYDGLPGKEGAFFICSFWLVEALALAGETEQAEEEFMKILKYRNPLGLFSEEIDPRSGLQIGNFPQAFSHIGLINASLYLGKRQGREGEGPSLMGSEENGN